MSIENVGSFATQHRAFLLKQIKFASEPLLQPPITGISQRAARVLVLGPELPAACMSESLRTDPRSDRTDCVVADVSPEALRMGQVEHKGGIKVSSASEAVSTPNPFEEHA